MRLGSRNMRGGIIYHLWIENHEKNQISQNFFKKISDESKKRYTSQQKYCVSMLKKTKKDYYNNLNEKDVNDNKIFWKTVKPFLLDKTVSKEQIFLVENDEIIPEDSKTAESLNYFFSNIAKSLKIPG